MPNPVTWQRQLISTAVVVVAVGSASGCEQDCNTVQPAYTGIATDEAWIAMLDRRDAAASAGDVPIFSAPAVDAALTKAISPTFTWTSPLKIAGARTAPSSTRTAVAPPRRQGPGLIDGLFELVVPKAWAHLEPITSDMYLLEIDVPGRACPVAGATTELSFTFASSDWEAIVEGGGARTARLMSAYLASNIVTEGPFLAAPLTFTVTDE